MNEVSMDNAAQKNEIANVTMANSVAAGKNKKNQRNDNVQVVQPKNRTDTVMLSRKGKELSRRDISISQISSLSLRLD
jgi:hypothetical protein